MKYEVGDKVLVRSDLPKSGYLPGNPCYVAEKMWDLRGQVVEIIKIDAPVKRYMVKESATYRWTEDMFEGLATPFKKGDKVMCIDARHCQQVLATGTVYTVKDVVHTPLSRSLDPNNPYIFLDKDKSQGYRSSRFAKYEEPQEVPFKKGDKVVCVDFDGVGSAFAPNEVYVVKELTLMSPIYPKDQKSSYYIAFDSGESGWYASRFEKYEEPKPKPCKFKVGDKVISQRGGGEVKPGFIYTIRDVKQRISGPNSTYGVSLDGTTWAYFYPIDMFEFASAYLDDKVDKYHDLQVAGSIGPWFTKKLVEDASNRMEQKIIASSNLGGMILKAGNIGTHDMVNRPKHYTNGGIECIDAIESAIKGLPASYAFLVGQIIKYIWRFYWKGKPLEDLEKAKFYLERLVSKVKAETK